MKKLLAIIILTQFASQAFAGRTDCPIAKVTNIQIEGVKVMYVQEGAPWRTLGYLNNNDGTKERYSALLSAQVSGRKVIVGYPIANYNCSVTNYGTSAYILRTHPN